MKSLSKIATLLLSTSLIFTAVGCGSTASTSNTEDKKPEITLTISAAASLKDSMEEIKKVYTAENKNIKILYNFGASGTLEKQIEQGADADLFLSAAPKQMNDLKAKNLTDESTRVDLLGNKVVLIVPKDSAMTIDSFKALPENTARKIALGEPKAVPAGQYAEEIFTKLGILDKIKAKAVYGNDVKQVLTWVEGGHADAGIVYETDAKTSSKVKVLLTAPQELYSPVIYPATVLKASKNTDAAKDFLKYLSSDKSKAIFEKYGFTFMPKK